MLRFGHEIRWCFAVADARNDVDGLPLRMRQKVMQLELVFLNFSGVSEVTNVRPLCGVPVLRFGHEIRWCFAVADARNDVVLCRCGCVRKLCSSCLSFSILVGFQK